MDSEGSSQYAAPKSKQERIRDNQRRSRARRQEYLAELERRLKDCHITCREAELQSAAFADLQIENSRLRELLSYVGVSPDVVETFRRQSNGPSPPGFASATASHRQIKPKFQPATMPRHSHLMGSLVKQEPHAETSSSASSATLRTPISSFAPHEAFPFHDATYRTPFTAISGAEATNPSQIPLISDLSSFDWTLSSDSEGLTTSNEGSYCSDTYHAPLHSALLADTGGPDPRLTVDTGVSPYYHTPAEMAKIKARLAMVVQHPGYPEPGSQVDNQNPWEVLHADHPDRLQNETGGRAVGRNKPTDTSFGWNSRVPTRSASHPT